MNTQKTKLMLFVQTGLNQTELSFEQAIDAMMQADFIPDVEIPDRRDKLGEMAIEFVGWQVHQASMPEWDYKSGKPDWYKEKWISFD